MEHCREIDGIHRSVVPLIVPTAIRVPAGLLLLLLRAARRHRRPRKPAGAVQPAADAPRVVSYRRLVIVRIVAMRALIRGGRRQLLLQRNGVRRLEGADGRTCCHRRVGSLHNPAAAVLRVSCTGCQGEGRRMLRLEAVYSATVIMIQRTAVGATDHNASASAAPRDVARSALVAIGRSGGVIGNKRRAAITTSAYHKRRRDNALRLL